MDRYKFINLFPKQQLSSNLRELTQSLPIIGVAYLDGIVIAGFDICEDMNDANTHVLRLSAIPVLPEMDDSEFFDDEPPSARKQLNYSTSTPTTSAESSTSKNATPTNPSHSGDTTLSPPSDADNRYISERDILNLVMDEDDDSTKLTGTPPFQDPTDISQIGDLAQPANAEHNSSDNASADNASGTDDQSTETSDDNESTDGNKTTDEEV